MNAIRAQAHLHHAYYLGLQLMVATRYAPTIMEAWTFRLFRRQHKEKFLSSFNKLGLTELPDAVACARYHTVANSMGGVPVEYHYESDVKAWVRFRYPRWMFHGPTLCAIPVEVSRGLLRGWYAHNGVSLGNPRLGFVCVSEDMTGEFGLCGYFQEFDHDLAEDERLQFAKQQFPPAFDPAMQPQPPAAQWDELRLDKAARNYALEFVRNALCELATVISSDEALEIGKLSARLIGLQYFQETASMVGAADGTVEDAVLYLVRMFTGMGDDITANSPTGFVQNGLRAVRGLEGGERALVLACWEALWLGALASQQVRKQASIEHHQTSLHWTISASPGQR